jgi:hypothetical protein
VSWPTTIKFMSPQEEAVRDAQWGGETRGYRAASDTCNHEIYLRVGCSPDDMARTLTHELAHCSQVEWLRDLFDETYLRDDGAALEQLACDAAARFGDVELVRLAERQPANR